MLGKLLVRECAVLNLWCIISVYPCSECFIGGIEALSLPYFVKRASSVVQGLQYVKIRGHEDMWGTYVFEMCKAFKRSSRFKQKLLVNSLGRQKENDVRVLSPELQVDASGNAISPEHHLYFWNGEIEDYNILRPLKISLPLCNEVTL